MAADPEYAAMMAERKAEYTRTRTAKRQAEREALVELAKTDEEAAKKLAEMRKYQSQATVRSYQKMKADAEAGDPDAIKRYETSVNPTLAVSCCGRTMRSSSVWASVWTLMWQTSCCGMGVSA